MTEHDATETAYKNGYEKAKQDILEKINKILEEHEKQQWNQIPLVSSCALRMVSLINELKLSIEKDL